MELGIVRSDDFVKASELAMGPGMGLGSVNGGRGRSVHEDVLLGRDCEIDGWEDVFGGGKSRLRCHTAALASGTNADQDDIGDEFSPMPDFHTEMERSFRMGW